MALASMTPMVYIQNTNGEYNVNNLCDKKQFNLNMITFELNVKTQFNKSFGIKLPLFPSI